jgi:hypothetical protein
MTFLVFARFLMAKVPSTIIYVEVAFKIVRIKILTGFFFYSISLFILLRLRSSSAFCSFFSTLSSDSFG